jgi:uncharacterized SAM-binding protein YcdF (DUF218 family)
MEIPQDIAAESKKFSTTYDALVVLGGGLRKDGDEYAPAGYHDSDDFGMLGGEMRVNAAVSLFLKGAAPNIVFTTGVYEKNIAKHGPDVPPEADVYARHFTDMLHTPRYEDQARDHDDPSIILENTSITTLTNIQEVLQLISDSGWDRVCIVTSKYHVPRVQALYEMALKKVADKINPHIDFLGAEDVVADLEPGVYDQDIREAYSLPEAEKRLTNEARGLADIKAGKYAIREFQLVLSNKP